MYKLAILETLNQDITGKVDLEPVLKEERKVEPVLAGFDYNQLFKIALFVLIGYLIIKVITK